MAVRAYLAGIATLADMTDHLLGPRNSTDSWRDYHGLASVTARKPSAWLRPLLEKPEIKHLVDRAVERILEVELAPGEAATPASAAALNVGAYRGTNVLLRLLAALGNEGFRED